MGTQMSYATIWAMWQDFGDTPLDQFEQIDEEFCGWRRKTTRDEIWRWFDEQYAAHGGVHALMFPDEHANPRMSHGDARCEAVAVKPRRYPRRVGAGGKLPESDSGNQRGAMLGG